ncbi:hypothetical protein CEV34_3628 [Brucella pseudogrignonensis]|uniref:Uncharacterized protein n=1 Tax=Brucella pseudogrignonensis TaxID=419475 RepID=A0A256G968_9HYPH|nr:hypothetical protein CEV34_3628 [Brucella pseudogrignonensis]
MLSGCRVSAIATSLSPTEPLVAALDWACLGRGISHDEGHAKKNLGLG